MVNGYGGNGRIVSASRKKRAKEARLEALRRLEEFTAGTYIDPVSGVTVTVLRRGHAWGAEPEKGFTQRGFERRRFG